jgi:phosphatidylglycerol lysyltransferase
MTTRPLIIRTRDWIAHRRGTLIALAVLIVAVLGFAAIHKLTAEIRLSEVRAAFSALGWSQLSVAIGLTVVSYIALTFYDSIALKVIGHPLPWRTAAVASFTSYTISHNLGLAMLTGGSARYRVYSRAGLDEAAVARVVLIAGVTFWAGVVTVACLSMAIHPGTLPIVRWTMPPLLERSVGIVIPLVMLGVVLRHRQGGSIGLLGWRLPLPNWRQALALLLVSTVDLAAASAALFVLLPNAAPELYPVLFLGYAVAIVVALISHVPGGLGVFEAVIIATMPQDNATVLAALLAYRIIYYVAPLILAAVLPVARARHRSTRDRAASGALATGRAGVPERRDAARVGRAARGPRSHGHAGNDPAAADQRDGACRGEPRRRDAASCRAGPVPAARRCVLGGADVARRRRAAFERRTRLTAEPLSPEWLVGVGAAIGLSVLIGFFAYRRVGYSSDLWWRFETDANASRFLRTSLAVGLLLIGAAIWRLFAAAPVPMVHDMLPDDVATAALAHADRTDAMLAFTGDKRFLVSDSGDAFLMYQVKGASWIVLGDPVGPSEAWSELLWAIRARADAAQGRLLLYQIGLRIVPIAIEMGLKLVKYGEEATVELDGFTLETPEMRSVRKASRVAERAGAEFAVVPAAEMSAIIPELQAISDWWLADKDHAEKSFSVGRFEPGYMAKFDCAVVRIEGRIVAFANVWGTPNRQELSVDLMRHAEDMPQGGMDFLFTRLMLWGHEQGYRNFSLGMAPLSGIEARRLSPTWSKVAAFLFRHGERFYGFAGLRAYKEKFRPNWTPRYIASPGGTSLLRGLIDLRALVSR